MGLSVTLYVPLLLKQHAGSGPHPYTLLTILSIGIKGSDTEGIFQHSYSGIILRRCLYSFVETWRDTSHTILAVCDFISMCTKKKKALCAVSHDMTSLYSSWCIASTVLLAGTNNCSRQYQPVSNTTFSAQVSQSTSSQFRLLPSMDCAKTSFGSTKERELYGILQNLLQTQHTISATVAQYFLPTIPNNNFVIYLVDTLTRQQRTSQYSVQLKERFKKIALISVHTE